MLGFVTFTEIGFVIDEEVDTSHPVEPSGKTTDSKTLQPENA